ncbi:MAG: GNAT family N-acetyltransferase [Magnetospirillum sp.]|nr:GNAT family N-acetyltransferase [Magnetospirillum sp.]
MSLVGLQWITNRDAYEAMLHTAGRSNLLQSWAWGDAKAETEGWRPRRAVLSVATVAVAVVQVLEKRVGPAVLARINRGPLWLYDDLTQETKSAVLKQLRRQWRWWKASALLIAPELGDGEACAATLPELGYRPRSAPIWRSAWVSLNRDEAELRKSLNGKWRNMLVAAEKAGLTTDVITGAEGVAFLRPLYEAMMAEKGFAGVSPPLLAALSRHADTDDLMVLRARSGDEDASAVLVARHGAAATYLVGWNGEAGRRTRANHLLLWQAMLELKERGVSWFDLGGIDDVLTPGVASFKRGLKGEDYALAGEWLSI